jgi:hypothetical protein
MVDAQRASDSVAQAEQREESRAGARARGASLSTRRFWELTIGERNALVVPMAVSVVADAQRIGLIPKEFAQPTGIEAKLRLFARLAIRGRAGLDTELRLLRAAQLSRFAIGLVGIACVAIAFLSYAPGFVHGVAPEMSPGASATLFALAVVSLPALLMVLYPTLRRTTGSDELRSQATVAETERIFDEARDLFDDLLQVPEFQRVLLEPEFQR